MSDAVRNMERACDANGLEKYLLHVLPLLTGKSEEKQTPSNTNHGLTEEIFVFSTLTTRGMMIRIIALPLLILLCTQCVRNSPGIRLRSEPTTLASKEAIIHWIQAQGFHHPGVTSCGEYVFPQGIQGHITHDYVLHRVHGHAVVIDQTTGLMWQQAGSAEPLTWEDGKRYLAHLNAVQYAGFSDWRLPTLEELVSLLEFTPNRDGFYLDPIFETNDPAYCDWTSDLMASGNAWVVSFSSGFVYDGYANYYQGYIRAVRSHE